MSSTLINAGKNAQVWYVDFIIALLLFILTIVFYFNYTDNLKKQEQETLDIMVNDVKGISSSLVMIGYPSDWDNSSVMTIGIANDQKLNATKLNRFKKLGYNMTKRKFGTTYDYFVFFVNNKGEPLNIKGVCGTGSPLLSSSFQLKSAYYYSDTGDMVMRDFMEDVLKSDIYFGNDGGDVYDIDGLVSNISKYSIVVLEHPNMGTAKFDSTKPFIESYSQNGGRIIVSGQIVTSNDRSLLGVDFRKKAGQALSDKEASINSSDDYIDLGVGQNITFSQAYYVQNNSASKNFRIFSTFRENNENAISNWNFGSGTNYFFSDLNTTSYNGNFVEAIQDMTSNLLGGTCTQANLTSIKIKRLVKTDRYLNYNSQVLKMVTYLWQ